MSSHLDTRGASPGKSYDGSAFGVLPGCADTGGIPSPGPHTLLMHCLPTPLHTPARQGPAVPPAQTCSGARGTGLSTSPSDHMNPRRVSPLAHKKESCFDTPSPEVSYGTCRHSMGCTREAKSWVLLG